MSSFKSYGKVNELDQMMLEAKRKTRKRITIISLSSIILVTIVIASVFGVVSNKNNSKNDDNNNASQNTVTNSMKAVCDVTLYKDSCYDSLSSVVNSSGKDIQPEELFKLSINVALTYVSKAVEYFNEHGVFEKLMGDNDSRSKEALRNCKDLFELAVDHLNNSLITSEENSSVLRVFDDLQTCYLKNSTEYTSNSLAIITWINKVASTLNLRRLLSLPNENEPPKWFHAKDRKLLVTKDLRSKADIVVAKDGSGKYRTISDALKHVPNKSKKRIVIYVKKGIYYENVRVEKTKWNVMIIGDGMTSSVVSGRLNFVDGTPTFSSATFAVFGKNFIARDMGFRNTAGPQKHQAVALMTSADQAVYYKCHIDAYQDTLYAHSNRQFYRECNIYGTVDFIFGNSAVVIQNCNIRPKLPMHGQQITITAQGKTDPNMNTGISIQYCNISPFGNLSDVQTYLGRPWKNYSTTVYMRSRMEGFVSPNGWLPWVGNSAPDTIFYAEFQNVGAGSSTKNRVKWKGLKNISIKEASKFSVKSFIQGDRWIPASNAPFKSNI
ncbi:hypothetical protein RYX36_017327 [Vicia faba]